MTNEAPGSRRKHIRQGFWTRTNVAPGVSRSLNQYSSVAKRERHSSTKYDYHAMQVFPLTKIQLTGNCRYVYFLPVTGGGHRHIQKRPYQHLVCLVSSWSVVKFIRNGYDVLLKIIMKKPGLRPKM